MKPLLEKHWHHLPQEEVLDLLETEDRQQNFGPNALTQRKGRGPLLRFLLQFNQALVYILLVAVIIKLFLGAWMDVFKASLGAGVPMVFLDVRTPKEWQDGVIEDALLINLNKLPTPESLARLPEDRNTIIGIYCKAGYPVTSAPK